MTDPKVFKLDVGIDLGIFCKWYGFVWKIKREG